MPLRFLWSFWTKFKTRPPLLIHLPQSFGLEDLAVLVLDEADRLLEMGFKEEVGLTAV